MARYRSNSSQTNRNRFATFAKQVEQAARVKQDNDYADGVLPPEQYMEILRSRKAGASAVEAERLQQSIERLVENTERTRIKADIDAGKASFYDLAVYEKNLLDGVVPGTPRYTTLTNNFRAARNYAITESRESVKDQIRSGRATYDDMLGVEKQALELFDKEGEDATAYRQQQQRVQDTERVVKQEVFNQEKSVEDARFQLAIQRAKSTGDIPLQSRLVREQQQRIQQRVQESPDMYQDIIGRDASGQPIYQPNSAYYNAQNQLDDLAQGLSNAVSSAAESMSKKELSEAKAAKSKELADAERRIGILKGNLNSIMEGDDVTPDMFLNARKYAAELSKQLQRKADATNALVTVFESIPERSDSQDAEYFRLRDSLGDITNETEQLTLLSEFAKGGANNLNPVVGKTGFNFKEGQGQQFEKTTGDGGISVLQNTSRLTQDADYRQKQQQATDILNGRAYEQLSPEEKTQYDSLTAPKDRKYFARLASQNNDGSLQVAENEVDPNSIAVTQSKRKLAKIGNQIYGQSEDLTDSTFYLLRPDEVRSIITAEPELLNNTNLGISVNGKSGTELNVDEVLATLEQNQVVEQKRIEEEQARLEEQQRVEAEAAAEAARQAEEAARLAQEQGASRGDVATNVAVADTGKSPQLQKKILSGQLKVSPNYVKGTSIGDTRSSLDAQRFSDPHSFSSSPSWLTQGRSIAGKIGSFFHLPELGVSEGGDFTRRRNVSNGGILSAVGNLFGRQAPQSYGYQFKKNDDGSFGVDYFNGANAVTREDFAKGSGKRYEDVENEAKNELSSNESLRKRLGITKY